MAQGTRTLDARFRPVTTPRWPHPDGGIDASDGPGTLSDHLPPGGGGEALRLMLDKALVTFEDLIRRSIAPSLTLLAVALAFEIFCESLYPSGPGESLNHLFRGVAYIWGVAGAMSSGALITLAILLIIGTSYALSALQQVLFDDRLRRDFEHTGATFLRSVCQRLFGVSGQDNAGVTQVDPGGSITDIEALKRLRKQVVERLTEMHLDPLPKQQKTDFILYEILGGIDTTSTRAYVDRTKAIGIFFVSLILVCLGHVVLLRRPGWWVATCSAVAAFAYGLGYCAICAQYRARAIRLYVNFLAMPLARINWLLLKEARDVGARSTS